MFTGIIEEVGAVKQITHGQHSEVLNIQARTVLENTKIGDSIAVNGVCLTVTNMKNNEFSADVMAETVRRSSLGALQDGSYGKTLGSGPWRRTADSAVISFPVTLTEPVRSNR